MPLDSYFSLNIFLCYIILHLKLLFAESECMCVPLCVQKQDMKMLDLTLLFVPSIWHEGYCLCTRRVHLTKIQQPLIQPCMNQTRLFPKLSNRLASIATFFVVLNYII